MTAGNEFAARSLASPWGGLDRMANLGGPVHWVDFGGPVEGGVEVPPLVLVHGLGGSHLNWVRVAPGLARVRRTVALDLVGFGMTPVAGRSASVRANTALLARFVEEVVGGPVVLVGNSMGGMISALLAADRPDLVSGLVLLDASLPIRALRQDPFVAAQFALFALPVVGEGYLRRSSRRVSADTRVRRTLELCFGDTSRIDPDVLAADVALATSRTGLPGVEAAFVSAARSLLAVLGRGSRYAAQLAGIDRPVLLVHGDADRLVPVTAARNAAAANPQWQTLFVPGVGHTPQLEVPDLVIDRLVGWLDGHD